MKLIYKLLLYSLFSILIVSCVPISSLFLFHPDKKDIKRFPYKKINPSGNCSTFKRSLDNYGKEIMINDCSNGRPNFISIEDFTPTHNVRSFLIIQNDTIKYEYYGQGTDKNTLHPSYSLAKSFISALVGIAIDEGFIKSNNDFVYEYLPHLSEHEYYKQLKISHLLDHTSGIKNDIKIDAHIYYGADIYKGLNKLNFNYKPGTKQEYINVNSQILGLVIKQATKKSPAIYLQEKIWKPLNMCNHAIWSTDKKNKIEKTFCCLGATSIDYAKFGNLYLNNGKYNDNQIISKQWINKTIKYNTNKGSNKYYNKSWYLGLEKYGDFMAKGLYKQYIYLNPNKNLIIVILNNREDKVKSEKVKWIYILRQISDQL